MSDQWPVASKRLAANVFQLLRNASRANQLQRGIDDTLRALHRNTASFVVFAMDVAALEMYISVAQECERKRVPFIFVPLRNELGDACGHPRAIRVATVMISDNEDIVRELKLITTAITGIM